LIAILVLAASACDSAVEAPATGSIHMTVETTGLDIDPDGYVVEVIGRSYALATRQEMTVPDVAPGPLAVTLVGVAPNCVVTDSNTHNVTVVAGSMAEVVFQVVCYVYPWSTAAHLPLARLGLAMAVVDGRIYTLGGAPGLTGPGRSLIERYDPGTEVWTTLAPIPEGRMLLGAAAVDGRVYAIGGEADDTGPILATVEAYDPATDTWTTRRTMPTPRVGLAVAALDGVIHAVGGSSTIWLAPGFGTVEAYDPATDAWSRKADMPTARILFTLVAADDRLYAIGGTADVNSASPLHTVEIYDPATDTWTAGPDMPTPRTGACGAAEDGKIWVLGGMDMRPGSTTALATLEALDPTTNTWSVHLSMQTARGGLACAFADGFLYAAGGGEYVSDYPNAPRLRAMWELERFDPHTGYSGG
jgi:N-acetylneuraminic acid mutarotase